MSIELWENDMTSKDEQDLMSQDCGVLALI